MCGVWEEANVGIFERRQDGIFLSFMVNITSANTDKDFTQLLSVDGLVNSKHVCHNGVVQHNKG